MPGPQVCWSWLSWLSCGGEATVMTPKCARCDGALWVCEAHDDRPWDSGATSLIEKLLTDYLQKNGYMKSRDR